MKQKTFSVRNIVLCAIFTALIAVGAFIRIPIPVLPVTLQLLFTTLAGLLLGEKLGAISVLAYIALGLLGVPIFADGGGIAYILKPSFGYLLGFCVGTYITGKIAHKVPNPSYRRLFASTFAGMGAIYAFGMVYFYLITRFYLGNAMSLQTLFVSCFLVFMPGDIFLCFASGILAKRLIPLLRTA